MNSITVNGTVFTKELVAHKLSTDVKWMKRAIIRLYERQTADEKVSQHTRNTNGRGFNQSDAFMFTSFAKQFQAGKDMTPKMFAYATAANVRGTKRLAKYAGQMLEVMAELHA